MEKGIIILGHGSKAPEALDTLKKLAEMAGSNLAGNKVVYASLQFNQPDLAAAVSKLVEEGVQKIVIAPLFLFYGIHLQEDIPAIIEELKAKYPKVEFVVANNLGGDARIAEIVIDRINEVS